MVGCAPMKKLLSILALAVVLACGGGKHYWQAQPAQGGPITIQPEQIWVAHGKLWVRTNVVNGTGQPIMINRDAIVARLPNGAVVHRAAGSATIHAPYLIPPGGAHAVYVEFYADGLDWQTVPNAQVDFSPGLTVNGQPMAVPPLMVSQ